MVIRLKFSGNIYNLMRQAGYHPDPREQKAGQMVFIRRLGTADYPRFHIYLKVSDVSRETPISLHLDQKKPIYKGATAHSGEYKGELVEKEAERIQEIAGL